MTAGLPPCDVQAESALPGDGPLYDREIEASLLAAMMLNTGAVQSALDAGLKAAHFGDVRMAAVAAAILDEHALTGAADHHTEIHRLRVRGELDLAGGELAVIALGDPSHVPAVTRAGHYARIVIDLARRRRMTLLQGDVGDALRTYGDVDAAMTRLVEAHAARFDLEQRALPGSAVLDVPSTATAAVWGSGDRVAWAEGESLLLVGASGIGKSLLLGQLAKARMGFASHVLGFPVQPGQHRTLYLAMDRPRQILRGLARSGVLADIDRTVLDERLVVWPGPPPSLVTDDTSILASMCRRQGADTLFIDSLKDLTAGLNTDEHGIAINTAVQRALASGVQVAGGHHHVKGGDPRALDAVYGSVFITAGSGSVFGLWAAKDKQRDEQARDEPGDDPARDAARSLVAMKHLKAPAADFAVDLIEHDVFAGTSAMVRGLVDVLALVEQEGCITAERLASLQTGQATPSSHARRTARTRLEREVEASRLRFVKAQVLHGRGRQPDMFCLPEAP